MRYAILPALWALVVVSAGSVQAGQISKPDESFGAASAVSDDQLASARARGSDPAIRCDNCSANGVSTVAGNAFQNAAGVFTVIQNTGNQVFMDTVTVVNVTMGK